MATVDALFATKLYRAELVDDGGALNRDIEVACRSIAGDDAAGRAWSRDNGYPGYTSYASLDDLPWRSPVFAALVKGLNHHVAAFAKDLAFDLGRRKLKLDSLWINVLDPGGMHSGHIHPHSAISGTYYVAIPKGASALKLEDPRLGLMMAAPTRKAPDGSNPQFAYVAPAPGTVLLWESWLRHEVPINRAKSKRISVSFNYA
jgi:uncharacterized protein (TIGR02466 family)